MSRVFAAVGFATILVVCPCARADEPRALAGPLFAPEGPGELRWRAAVGTLVDLQPKRIVETAQYDTPQVAVSARLGLPRGFSVDLRANTLFVSGRGDLGVAWAYRRGRYSLGLQDHQGVALSSYEDDNATATMWGLVNAPGLSAGLALGDVHLSLTGEVLVVFDQHTKAQTGANLTRKGTQVGGTSLMLVAEDVFSWGLVYVGAGWMRTSADYLAWFPYYDPRARINYPRLTAGYAF